MNNTEKTNTVIDSATDTAITTLTNNVQSNLDDQNAAQALTEQTVSQTDNQTGELAKVFDNRGKNGKGKKGKGGFDFSTMKRLIKYIFSKNKGMFTIAIIAIVLSAAANVANAVFLRLTIDNVVEPGLVNGFESVKNTLTIIILSLAGVFFAGIVCQIITSQLMAIVTQRILTDFRVEMFDKMQKLPIRFFDTHERGDIMSHYTNDVDAIRQMVSQSIQQIINSLVMIVVLLVVMLIYSIWLSLIVLASVVVMALATKSIGGKSAKYFVAQQQSVGSVEGFIEEIMNGQKVVKVFNHENEAESDFNKINDKLYDDSFQANKYGNILMPVVTNIGNLLYVVLALVGGAIGISGGMNVSLLGIGELTLGTLVSFLPIGRQFTNAIAQSAQNINAIAMGNAGARRIFELNDQEPEVDDGYVELVNTKKDESGNFVECEERTGFWAWRHPHKADGTVTYTPLTGDIVLDHVDFGYTEDKLVLHDITLYAKQGQKVAFVGATGAGKTTITNLINRFYDIDDGKVRYDGININKIKKSSLRRSLGIVLQDTNLFTGTVMDNIRYGNEHATEEEVYEAARIANADDFIRRLPDGYNTMLRGNGANLSQGQRQLISIARAACADAPVLILDEATSSIDTRTEAIVQKGMDNLMKGRTVFVIAHRLSTIHNSDVIMVLDHGRIIERGNHDSLIKEKGVYYQLYNGAFELE